MKTRILAIHAHPDDVEILAGGTMALLAGAGQAAPPLKAIPHLYYMDPVGGVDPEGRPVRADFYVDVKSVFEKKTEMLARHKSQREWLRKHHGIDDYLVIMEQWTRELGRR